MTVKEALSARSLPRLMQKPDGTPVKTVSEWGHRREEILNLLQREEYGFLPPPPASWEVTEEKPLLRCSGFAYEHRAVMRLVLADGTPFSFPFVYTIPISDKPCRAFLLLNFRPDVPDRYLPSEEINDHGFAVFSFCYEDVTSDDGDFGNGLAAAVFHGRERQETDPGKIALWSWAASRICDFMMTLPALDHTGFAVIGHSRLGKTALLTGALDDRFAYVISNCAGCSGDAPMRGKTEGNETVAKITATFPYWFCPAYLRLVGHESEASFDQHFLLAAIAPRYLLIGAAEKDFWADQAGEYLSAYAAGEAWQLYGFDPGLPDERMPEVNDEFASGRIGFHYRAGVHFLGRGDWGAYLRFLERHPTL